MESKEIIQLNWDQIGKVSFKRKENIEEDILKYIKEEKFANYLGKCKDEKNI